MKDKKKLLTELVEIAKLLGITVRFENTNARGGLCRVNDTYYIIIDKKASIEYKINILVNSLKRFDLSKVHLKPKLRELIEEFE
ncbi:hypothetical protein OWM07_04665 [Deferribacter thermophilus]|uniref:hypothetical protein n=1 Tax=Deferribacter thermophilus TaxID=53573 RepID=UPI003C1F248E